MAEWGKKRDGRALGLAYLDYSGSQVAGLAEISLDRSEGEIKMHNFWCTIDCGSPTTWWRRPKAASSTVSAWR